MAAELRPMSLGELLDRTFTYYREHFWLFVGIVAPAETLAIATTLLGQLLGLNGLAGSLAHPAPNPADQIARLIPFYLSMIASSFVTALALTIALSASSTAVSRIHLGQSVSIADAYGSLRGQIGRVAGLYGLFILITIGAYLLPILGIILPGAAAALLPLGGGKILVVIIAILLGLVGVVGGTVLACRILLQYSLAVPALVLERVGPVAALKRSSRLAKGSLGRIFLAALLMFLISMVVAFTFQAPFWAVSALMGFKLLHNPIWLLAPATVAGGIGAAFGYPLLMIVVPLFYYDARVRKEGFDLQAMMLSMDSAPADPIAASSLPDITG